MFRLLAALLLVFTALRVGSPVRLTPEPSLVGTQAEERLESGHCLTQGGFAACQQGLCFLRKRTLGGT